MWQSNQSTYWVKWRCGMGPNAILSPSLFLFSLPCFYPPPTKSDDHSSLLLRPRSSVLSPSLLQVIGPPTPICPTLTIRSIPVRIARVEGAGTTTIFTMCTSSQLVSTETFLQQIKYSVICSVLFILEGFVVQVMVAAKVVP